MFVNMSPGVTQSFMAPGLQTWATETEKSLPVIAKLCPGIHREREKKHFLLVSGNEKW